MALDNLSVVQTPPIEALSPTDYSDDLYAFGAASIHAVGRCLVAQSQQPLGVLEDPTHIGGAAVKAQSDMRKMAQYYLDVFMPRVIGMYTQADASANMIIALKTSLEQSKDASSVSAVINATAEQFESVVDKARDADHIAATQAKLTEKAYGNLKTTVDTVVKKLEGDDGEIAQQRKALEALEKEAFQSISDIVTNSKLLGKGIGALARKIMNVIQEEDEGPEKDPSKDKDTSESKAKPASKDTKKIAGEVEPFKREDITTISDSAEGVAEAEHRLLATNAKLADEYATLAELNALLAAVQAVLGQADNLNRAAQDVSHTTTEIVATVSTLAQGLRQLAEDAKSADDLGKVMATVNAQVQAWQRFRNRMMNIELAFSGGQSWFPPVID